MGELASAAPTETLDTLGRVCPYPLVLTTDRSLFHFHGTMTRRVYGLNILDAYVNGHLIGFDVGEDLSAGLIPDPAWPRLAVRISL